jgi:hypothetical protein
MGEPAKRKKFYTQGEVIDLLKEKKHKVAEVCKEITETLYPFEINEDAENEELEKLAEVAKKLNKKIWRLSKDFKDKKMRRATEAEMKEKVVSCSQHSVLQSEESQNLESSEDEPEKAAGGGRPDSYRKKPLNAEMTSQTRRRRVAEKRKQLQRWAEEEGLSPVELLGTASHHTVSYYSLFQSNVTR